mmetsp:Transcript_60655/g.112511  ORF Transcript_60655/g.112511 Transcript_60655/m.112511 type:complete len:318 (+) Transcript_60655:67-1020(+)
MPTREMLGSGGRQAALARCNSLLKQLPVSQLAMIEPTLRTLVEEKAAASTKQPARPAARARSCSGIRRGCRGVAPVQVPARGQSKATQQGGAAPVHVRDSSHAPSHAKPSAVANSTQCTDTANIPLECGPLSALASRAMSSKPSPAEVSNEVGSSNWRSWEQKQSEYPTYDARLGPPATEPVGRRNSMPAVMPDHLAVGAFGRARNPQKYPWQPDGGVGYVARARRRHCQAGTGAADAMKSWGMWRMWQEPTQARAFPVETTEGYATFADNHAAAPAWDERGLHHDDYIEVSYQPAIDGGWQDLGSEGFEFRPARRR